MDALRTAIAYQLEAVSSSVETKEVACGSGRDRERYCARRILGKCVNHRHHCRDWTDYCRLQRTVTTLRNGEQQVTEWRQTDKRRQHSGQYNC